MALQRFLETFAIDLRTWGSLERRKITESEIKGLASKIQEGNDGIGRLSEATKKYFEQNPVATLEGKTVWRFPISRFDWINANGRKYERRLWQRVIELQKEAYQGNVGLADHPKDDEDGKFKESAIVWLNLALDDSSRLVYGEGILVGDSGRLAEEIMEAGGRIGFSSSGFGELDESDKSTVRWDSFQLERPADIVLNPSQNVFGKYEMKMDKRPATHESVEELNEGATCPECGAESMKAPKAPGKPMSYKCKSCGHAFSKDEKKESVIKETTPMPMPDVKISKLEEKRFRRDVGVFLTEADKITDPQEKLSQLEDIVGYFNEGVAPDLKEEVDKKIVETKEKIQKAIKEYAKTVETFGVEDTEALKEGVKRVAIDTQLFLRDAEEWKNIATGLQEKVQKLSAILSTRPTSEAYKTAMTFSAKLKESFKQKEEVLLAQIASLEEANGKEQAIEEVMVKELGALSDKNQKYVEEYKKLREYALRLQGAVKRYQEKEANEKKAFKEKVVARNTINIKPQAKSNRMFEGFREDKEIEEYYEDLVATYGNSIKPYEEKIKGSKTVKEAMSLFMKIFSEMDAPRTRKITEALEPEDRQRIIEAQTGVRIAKQSRFQERLPKAPSPEGQAWV